MASRKLGRTLPWPTKAQLRKQAREAKSRERAIENRVDQFLQSLALIAHAMLLIGQAKQAEETRRKRWDSEDTRERRRQRGRLRFTNKRRGAFIARPVFIKQPIVKKGKRRGR